jgi:hypothetical protein
MDGEGEVEWDKVVLDSCHSTRWQCCLLDSNGLFDRKRSLSRVEDEEEEEDFSTY